MLIRDLLHDSELYFYRLNNKGGEGEDPKFFVNFFLFVFELRFFFFDEKEIFF